MHEHAAEQCVVEPADYPRLFLLDLLDRGIGVLQAAIKRAGVRLGRVSGAG